MLYKILTAEQLATLRAGGLMQAPVDVADGYVHFSTSQQVQETLAKWFKGQTGLSLAVVSPDALGDSLRWEVSRGGDWFPHAYCEVREHHVASVIPLIDIDVDGINIVPAEILAQPEPRSKPGRPA